MTKRNAAGTRLTKAQFQALLTQVEDPPAIFVPTEDLYIDYTPGGDKEDSGMFEKARRLLLAKNSSRITQAEVDALFAAATFTSITPASGPQAGGTNVVIKGTNFAGTASVTIGGVATTNFKVVDNETITCTTGAHAAGAVPVVIADDNANVTTGNVFTYV